MAEEKSVDVEDYNIIGSGGFGLVAKHKENDTVMKFFYKDSACLSAGEESALHKIIYEKILEITRQYPELMIYTSTPIAFRNQELIFRNKYFRCAYTMTYIPSVLNFKELIHIILKESYEGMVNKIVGRNYSEPASENNPARGFFATGSYIQENIIPKLSENIKGPIKTIEDIAFRLGVLCGTCIFGAKLIPVDAEYVLSVKKEHLYIAILDFGMFQQMELKNFFDSRQRQKILDKYVKNIKEINDIDLYFPYDDEPFYENWKEGMTFAYKFFVPKIEDSAIRDSLTYIGNALDIN